MKLKGETRGVRETGAISRDFLSGKGQCSEEVLETWAQEMSVFKHIHQTTKENTVIIKMWVLNSGMGVGWGSR